MEDPPSYSTIRWKRKIFRNEAVKKISANFNRNDYFIVHWDGKGLKESNNNIAKNVENISVSVTSGEKEKLLEIPVTLD